MHPSTQKLQRSIVWWDGCYANSVEHWSTLGHVSVVMQLRTVIVLALAWLPLTRACELRSVPGLGFLECSAREAHAEPKDAHEHLCCLEEHSDCLMERRPPWHTPRPVTNVPAESSGRPSLCSPTTADRNMPALGPPEISASWVFAQRAALPARAPSLSSEPPAPSRRHSALASAF